MDTVLTRVQRARGKHTSSHLLYNMAHRPANEIYNATARSTLGKNENI